MKIKMNRLATFLLTVVLIVSTKITALAAESTITFKGVQDGFTFQPGSEYTATDLFDNFKDIMPGDNRTETIQITNIATDCDYIKLYMRAAVHDEAGNPLTYSEEQENADGNDQTGVVGQRGENYATMQDFLSRLSLKLYHNDTVIYEASPEELGGLQNNVYLATLGRGATAELTVELSVPTSLGNEYANRVGEVDWIFVVEGLDYPDPPQETPTPDDPQVILPPKTGDNAPIALFGVLAGASLVILIGLIVVYRKSKRRGSPL